MWTAEKGLTIHVMITAKPDDHKPLILTEDCLIYVPCGSKMGEYDGTHG